MASFFKASRTPVREALLRLEQDHLIGHLERGEKEAATKLIKDHVANAASHVRSVVNTQKGPPPDATQARD